MSDRKALYRDVYGVLQTVLQTQPAETTRELPPSCHRSRNVYGLRAALGDRLLPRWLSWGRTRGVKSSDSPVSIDNRKQISSDAGGHRFDDALHRGCG